MAAEIDRTVIKELRSTDILNQIAKIVQEIRFGSVEIIIHEGRVVQLERKEKLRFDAK
ncbi:MAG: YezD family protein [Methylococcales bacterium]